MKKCAHCGRLGMFFYLDGDGLCEKCSEVEKKRRQEQARASALEQVKKASAAFQEIAEYGAHLPDHSISWLSTCDVPAGRVEQLRANCALICAVLNNWENIPFFEEAVHDVCNQDDGYCFYHPDMSFGQCLWFFSKQEDFRKDIPPLVERVQKLDEALELYGKYEYRSYRIVGTSFKNDDGISRQRILWEMEHKVSPFHDEVVIRLEKYKFEGEDAIAVFANDRQVGHIARDDAQFLVLPKWDRYAGVSGYTISGGVRSIRYILSIEVMFYKES